MRDTSNVAVNRNYKDTVFRMLFSDKKNLLSLYNAVNERNYTNPDELEIVTLENAIYISMNINLPITRIFHCGICFIYPVNIRDWSIKNHYTYPAL